MIDDVDPVFSRREPRTETQRLLYADDVGSIQGGELRAAGAHRVGSLQGQRVRAHLHKYSMPKTAPERYQDQSLTTPKLEPKLSNVEVTLEYSNHVTFSLQ